MDVELVQGTGSFGNWSFSGDLPNDGALSTATGLSVPCDAAHGGGYRYKVTVNPGSDQCGRY